MANGNNEPVQFTRGDAERLRTTEVKIGQTHTKIDELHDTVRKFVTKQDGQETRIAKNERFRRNCTRMLLWILTSGAGMGMLTIGAKAVGWIE